MSDSTKKRKRYVKGSAKEVVFNNGGSLINVDLNLNDLKTLTVNKSGYIKLVIERLRKPDAYGNTHSVYENDYVAAQPKTEAQASPKGQKPTDTDNLPPWVR